MKKFLLLLFLPTILGSLFSCSTNESPENPTIDPFPDNKSEIVELKILSQIEIIESPLFPTRSGNSNDLIGVQINRISKLNVSGNAGISNVSVYASGVFDDIDDIKFKFVKGDTYSIIMTYYPNAKNIVYNFPNGIFGYPFSDMYGLQNYFLNEPVYYDGVEWDHSGNQGPVLEGLLDCSYQPTSDYYIGAFKRGNTPRYTGQIENLTINEQTSIIMPLELCMMGITLNAQNFTEGELQLVFRYYANSDFIIKPGDNPSTMFQIPYGEPNEEGYYGGEELELFYTSGKGEKYLLATKVILYKRGTNYIFNFNLTEREDGSIGIQLPNTTDQLQDEENFLE